MLILKNYSYIHKSFMLKNIKKINKSFFKINFFKKFLFTNSFNFINSFVYVNILYFHVYKNLEKIHFMELNNVSLNKNFFYFFKRFMFKKFNKHVVKSGWIKRLKKKFLKIKNLPRRIKRFFFKRFKWIRYKSLIFKKQFHVVSFYKNYKNIYLYLFLTHISRTKIFKKIKKIFLLKNIFLKLIKISHNYYFFLKNSYHFKNNNYFFNKLLFLKNSPFFKSSYNLRKRLNKNYKIGFKKFLKKFFYMQYPHLHIRSIAYFYFKKIDFINLKQSNTIKITFNKFMKSNMYMFKTSYKIIFFKKNYFFFRKRRKKYRIKKYFLKFYKFFLLDIFKKDYFPYDIFRSQSYLNKYIFKKNFSTNFFSIFFFKNYDFDSYLNNKNNLKLINDRLKLYFNTTPLFFLKSITKKLISTKFQQNYTPNFHKYIYHYYAYHLERVTKKRIFLRFNTNINLPFNLKTKISEIFHKHKSYQLKIGKGFFFTEMLEILWLTFFYKDLNFLINWLVKTLHRIKFQNHRKFLGMFKIVMNSHKDFFIENNNVGGFFFDIRGKVGVTGDAKKRHVYFSLGKFSKTTKHSRFDYQHNIIRTATGVLGLTLILYY